MRTSSTSPLHIIQIVRRFTPNGGMERYVWELCRELALAGHRVTVLCERQETPEPAGPIEIVTLGSIRPKPRWLSHLRFSRRVADWLQQHADEETVIHSHERTGSHHVTTFHGPPFAAVREKPWWQKLSPRIYANLWLERREVCGAQVQAVVPNSVLIAERLAAFYPCIGDHLTAPVPPGVEPFPPRPTRDVPADGGIVGFVGKEWQRKGLDIAVRIVEQMRKARPGLIFRVAGPEPDAVLHLFSRWQGGYELLGRADVRDFYQGIDLLIHPARMEPFGMVITEAMSAGVPVLVSDQCGARSEVPAEQVLSLNQVPETWATLANTLIDTTPSPYRRSWQQVAMEQLAIYRELVAHA
ncbi:MAG TPA: glycosyltransferase family 4 protein [Mariprofundaceae bacterium]|nr:glycosyltransferase family 4 protein [Mariprofundaceae bacterium]